jgi:hypothetical protein
MAGEFAPAVPTVDVNEAFEQIVQDEFDQTFDLAAAEARAEAETVPFGLFTEAGAITTLQANMRAAMATSTGHTGNNAEESA